MDLVPVLIAALGGLLLTTATVVAWIGVRVIDRLDALDAKLDEVVFKNQERFSAVETRLIRMEVMAEI